MFVPSQCSVLDSSVLSPVLTQTEYEVRAKLVDTLSTLCHTQVLTLRILWDKRIAVSPSSAPQGSCRHTDTVFADPNTEDSISTAQCCLPEAVFGPLSLSRQLCGQAVLPPPIMMIQDHEVLGSRNESGVWTVLGAGHWGSCIEDLVSKEQDSKVGWSFAGNALPLDVNHCQGSSPGAQYLMHARSMTGIHKIGKIFGLLVLALPLNCRTWL
ncbi:hypothetical protein STEG23_025612 [Scotinomys teguina]